MCVHVCLECAHAYFVPEGALDRACNGAAADMKGRQLQHSQSVMGEWYCGGGMTRF